VNDAPSQHGVDRTHYVHGAALTRRTHNGVLVLALDDGTSEPIMLSGTGVPMWDAFATAASIRTVAMQLAAQFATDVAAVEVAIAPVVARLVASGALAEAG
jgi:hypothetical protein